MRGGPARRGDHREIARVAACYPALSEQLSDLDRDDGRVGEGLD